MTGQESGHMIGDLVEMTATTTLNGTVSSVENDSRKDEDCEEERQERNLNKTPPPSSSSASTTPTASTPVAHQNPPHNISNNNNSVTPTSGPSVHRSPSQVFLFTF